MCVSSLSLFSEQAILLVCYSPRESTTKIRISVTTTCHGHRYLRYRSYLIPDLVLPSLRYEHRTTKRESLELTSVASEDSPLSKNLLPRGGALVFYATKERGAKEIWSLPSQRLSRNGEEFLLCLFVFLSVGCRIRTL